MARDYKDHGQGRSYGLERTLTVILFLVFALAIATGILSFIRLNNVIHSVESSVRPDRSMILAKDIFSYLTAAENSVKSYSLTQREEDMVRFYSLTEAMSAQMRELKDISGDDPYLVGLIDSLDRMVSKKFEILDQLLVIQDEYLVEQAMHQVMRNIREQEKASGETAEETATADTVAEQDKKKRDSFFRRLFSKKRDKEEQPSDTLKADEPAPPALTLEEISSQVEKAQQKALTDERLLREQELELFRQDNILMNKIRDVLDEMEAREDLKLRANILLAEKEASEVKTIILTYGLAALLLLLLVAISIYTYIRRNTEYQKVLSEARANAEDLARKKEGFLANMSHEIRTPMNIISGYLDLILKGKLAESQREKVEIVKKSSTHLIQLLNNLLDLSRVQAGKLKLLENEFSPGEIISDMEKWFAAFAKEKGLELKTFVDPGMPQWIAGDPVRLRQILFNVTSNAIKFTSSGKVSISMSPVEQDQDKILTLLEVSDSGPGISKEDQQRIFEHFEQVNPSGSVVSEGSGLGLAITLQLVKLMDGDIELDSSPGQGSTFRIKIPFRVVKTEKAEELQISGHDRDLLNRLKVMVVDDEEYNRRLVRMMLEKYQCIIIEAESGEEAVKMAGKEGWDIIIMDIRMTGMGGLEAARAIKKNAGDAGNPVPVIAFSAGLTDKDHENLTKNGFDDFLAKPFEEQELIRTILKQARIGSPVKGHGNADISTRKVKEQKGESPGYDLTPLITSSNGNEKFLEEMVTLFIENTDSGLQQIKEHLEREEWMQAADLAHKISGPCRHMKATALHSSLKNLEKSLGKNIDLKRSEGILKEAIMEFERIREDILARYIK